MTDLTYVCLYRSYMEDLTPYNMEQLGRLVMAMMRYTFLGEEPEFDGPERYIWPTLRSQCERDKGHYETRCETNRRNGAKGVKARLQGNEKGGKGPGTERSSERPIGQEASIDTHALTDRSTEEPIGQHLPQDVRQNSDRSFGEPMGPKEKEKEKEKDKEKDKEREREKEKEKEKETPPAGGGDWPPPPGVEAVRAFCLQEGISGVEPERFVNYYQARGWMLGSTPMADWRSALKVWAKRGDKQEQIGGSYDRYEV